MVLERTCLNDLIEPTTSCVGMAAYVQWQPKGKISSSGECTFVVFFNDQQCITFAMPVLFKRCLLAELVVVVM